MVMMMTLTMIGDNGALTIMVKSEIIFCKCKLQWWLVIDDDDGDYGGDDRQSYVAIKYFYIHFTR